MALEKGYNGDDRKDFPVAPDGVYKCDLMSIEAKLMPKYGEPEVEETRWLWKFVSLDEADENGKPYEFGHWTGFKYGNDKAKLTITLDSMLGYRLTEEQWEEFDPEDELVGKTWRIMVSEITTQTGKKVNRVIKVSPLKPPTKTIVGDGSVRVESGGKTRTQAAPLKKVKAAGSGADAQGRMPDDPNYDPYEGE